ncbi:hypothetical protein LPJ57_005528 [Coemansia sp. RSA 486]|nr:hypothetical protein LPJ57_005528 [Coemansia sp. RSA 486]KAJ2235900.1 hypothetical protein IWW45_002210 [Coemansia sp. RSA 485]
MFRIPAQAQSTTQRVAANIIGRRVPRVRAYSSAPTKAESQKLFDEINTFWFGESDRLHDQGKASFQKWWFQPSTEIDSQIKQRFGPVFQRVIDSKEHVDNAKETPEGTLALIILLDQMGRNMYRGEARAFSGDIVARSLAMYMVRRKFHEMLRPVKQSFVYMPLMHAEDIEAQDLSVQLYTELAEQLGAPDEDARNDDFGKFAEMHRDVIRDFGRFPSRNKALGRETTPEEAKWLENAPF